MKTTKYIISIALALSCALGNVFAVNKTYYNSVNGKQDSQLREALTTLVFSKHTNNVGYTWDFENIDVVGGEVLDMYSTCVWTSSQQGKNYNGICDGYNREHVVPQNLFSESLPQKGDRHHLFLTDGKVNGMRSSYPFGETNVTTGFSGITNSNKALGKLGTSSGNFSGTVYEPDDEYKGDIARAIMYMAIRYATTSQCRVGTGSTNAYPVTAWSNDMFSGSLSTNYGLSNAAVAVYMKWHRNDAPSAKEIARNNGVEALQGNRNPFIDYPELAEYLWGNKTGTAVVLDDLTPTFDSPCSGKHGTPNVTAVAGDGQITLTWEDVTGASSYTVLIGAGEGYTTECSSPSVGAITHSGTTNTCIITGLVNGLSYTTSVVAKGGTTCDSDADTDTTIPVEETTTYEIRFFNNGVQVGETQNLYIGQTAVKPADPTACTGYTFVGWWTETLAEDNTTAETWVTDFTVTGAQDYYAVYSHVDGEGGGGTIESYGFETADDASNWEISGVEAYDTYSKTGSKSGKIARSSAGNSTITFKNKVKVTSFAYQFLRQTTNNNYYVYIETSSDKSSWTPVETYAMNSYTSKETWYSNSHTFDGETELYVRFNCYTSTAIRWVDDISITYGGGSSTTYYTTEPDCVECLNKVTIEKGEENNGTFSLDKDGTYDNCKAGGIVVHVSDIAPSEDYQFKEITQEGIASGVTIDQENKTVTYEKDVAGSSIINVVFEHKPTYTIRFYNGESLISTQSVTKDKSPSVPADPVACDGYTFVGWWTSSLPASNTESHTWVSDFTVTDNQDYYAIYRHNEGGSGSGNVTFTPGTDVGATSVTKGGVTCTMTTMDNASYYQIYSGYTGTFSVASGNITSIAITCTASGTSKYGPGNITATPSGYTYSGTSGTWSGSASSVEFTGSQQIRMTSIVVTIDGGGTAHYTSVFSCTGHTITVSEVEHGSGVSDKSRCDEGGTVTITLTADEGYECGGITTSPSVTTTEASECTYTFTMPDADITVTPVFTPKTPRTFTFEEGTGICETASLTEAVWHGGVTLPTATANSGCDPEYVFAGWAKAAVTTETEVRPTLYAAGTLYNEEETTLYAVYSQTTGGSASGFTLSYTYNDVTYYAAARTGSNSYMDASTNEAEAARFSIVTSKNKKYLCWHGDNDTYVYNSGNNTTLRFTTELANASNWLISEEGTAIILRDSTSGRYFMFNTNQKDRFSTYTSPTSPLTKGDAGTTVYNTNPSCVCYSVNITYNANGGTLAEGCEDVVGGDCERDWKLCDAPTRDGYVFTNWKDQNGTLYSAGATVSKLKLSLTLTAQWIPAPYTVLFDAGSGSCVESLTEPSRGDGIILPKAEPSAACAEDWTFIGWSETALVGETNTTASIIGVAGTPYTPASDNVTLYAVYSTLDEGGATTDYTRVTASTPEEGDYVIVVAKSDASFGLVTYGTTSNGRLAYTKAYTSLPTTTILTPAATQIWHLTYDPEGYAYLYNADAGAYLSASGYNITFNASAGSAFVLTRNAGTYGDYECLNNTATASESKNYYLGANKDADYIRYYGSTTLIALNSVTLYKGSTGTRYYSTAPVCTPCTDPEWSFELGTSVVKTKGSEPFTNNVIKGHESGGTVTYSSTNEAVATVDASGEVTLVGTGNTTITLRLTKKDPYCAAVLQYELEVKEPSIDIVGVTPDGEIVVEHDLEGTITLDLSEGHAISTGTAANDLFFSKYFEAASNMKLFSIFNGTGHDMDISDIRVRCNCTTDGTSVWSSKTGDLGYVELRTISKLREQYPKMKIPSGTELIFWSNNKGGYNESLRDCIVFTIGDMEYHYSDMEAMEIPNWFCLGDYTKYNKTDADGNNQFVFNGDDSMIMERYNPTTGKWEAIDVFGAGTSEAPASTEGLVENIDTEYEINNVSQKLNDGDGFHAECAGNPIPLSTNRYMLVRKNSVVDGMHAVASNATSFATLCEEWDGTPVGGSTSGFCYSGEIFSDIAEYDYAENYIDWETITHDDYEVEEKENGTTTITFDEPLDLDARACSLLKIEVRDKDDASKILATTEYKIPIVVKAGEVMTSADLFHDQGDKCATCDVAILGSATLTKATDGATNDMPEVRDIYVYGGGQLVIPEGTHYRAHDLIMRMEMAADKMNVNVPNIQATGSLTNQYGGAIRQQVRVGTNRFYQFAVPYPVRLEDVTFSDGRPAIYGEDFMIRYYDGESRAQNLGTASNWKNFEGTELQPGVGYTLAVAKKAGHEQRELIFPMADASLEAGEPATKTTAIHAWGDNTIRANHRGWNFLSNPYLTTYGEDNLYGDASSMLTTGQLVPDPEHPGWWVNNSDAIPYVTLINGTRTDYSQELVSLQELPPFTTFFIQAGDDDHHSGEEFSLTFNRDHRKASAPAYIRAKQKAPVARFGVLLNGNNATDNCGMVIGEDYSAAYDMQADLSKEFGSAYSLKLYTLQEDQMRMAFLATHPDSLRKPVPVGVRMPANAEYTFSLDRRYNLGAFDHIYLTDNVTGQHTDLLDDNYSFTGTRSQNDTRFSLFVEMKKDTPTSVETLLNGIYVTGRKGALILTGLPETADIYIYDMSGRIVQTRHTHGETSVTCMAPTGVYQIRIQSEGAKALLRTIVH